MKTSRKITALFLALLMVISLLPTTTLAATHQFTDVSDNQWFAEPVEYVYANNLMQGDGNKFRPNDPLSRAEMVQLLYNCENKPPVDASRTGFDDVSPGVWYASAVVWAFNKGIVTGTSRTTFSPNANITRQDMITAIWRYIKIIHPDKYVSGGDYSRFADAGKVAAYASEAMRWAVGKGIINGEKNGVLEYLNPTSNTTRAQMAKMLMSVIQTVLEAGGSYVLKLQVFDNIYKRGSVTINGKTYTKGAYDIKIPEGENITIDFKAASDGFISYFQVDGEAPKYLGYNYSNINGYNDWSSYSYTLTNVDKNHSIKVYFIQKWNDESLVYPGGGSRPPDERLNGNTFNVDRALVEGIYGETVSNKIFDYYNDLDAKYQSEHNGTPNPEPWVDKDGSLIMRGVCGGITMSSMMISQPWYSGIRAADFIEDESYMVPSNIKANDVETVTGKDLSLLDMVKLWQAAWPLYGQNNQGNTNWLITAYTNGTIGTASSSDWDKFFKKIEHYMETHADPLYIRESGANGKAHALMVVGVEGHENFGSTIAIHVMDPNRGRTKIVLTNKSTTSYDIETHFSSPTYTTTRSLSYFEYERMVDLWNGWANLTPQNTYRNSSLLMVSTNTGSMDGISVAAANGAELELLEPPTDDPEMETSYVKMFMVPNDTSYIITNTTDASIRVALGNAHTAVDAEIEPGVSAELTVTDTGSGSGVTFESATEANGSATIRFDDTVTPGVSGVTVSGSFIGAASVTKSNGSVLADGFNEIETLNEYNDGSTVSNSHASLSGQAAEINDVTGVITVDGVDYSDNLSSTDAKATLGAPTGLSFVNGIATWNAVSGAEYYEVRVLKNGSVIGLQDCTADCYYDFSSYIRVEGAAYSFEVSATGSDYLDSPFVRSNVIYAASALPRPAGTSFSGGIATWDAVPGAAGYELMLYNYNSGQVVSDGITVGGTVYDFTSDMDNGVYYYSVKALGNGASNKDSVTAVSDNYAHHIMLIDGCAVDLDITTSAPNESLGGADALTEYEGKQVTLKANVADDSGQGITGGYVYFYKNGHLLNFEPVAVFEGKAEYAATISAYTGNETNKLDNYDIFTASYSYVGSTSSADSSSESKVYIRSTTIAAPIISANGATTASGVINNLPAATSIAFSFSDTVVKANDGRILVLGTDYSYAWQKTMAAGFADISGANASAWTDSGSSGDSWRLRLAPIGNMVTEGVSLQANIGQKSDPDINLIITSTFTPSAPTETNNFHAGDEVTLAAKIYGTAAGGIPTGWVTFYAGSTAIRTVQLSTGYDSSKFFAEASVATILNDPQTLDISVKYYGDNKYNAGNETEASNKVWSTQIDAEKISVSGASGTKLTAGTTYTLTLDKSALCTDSGEKLEPGKCTIEWQVNTGNGWVTQGTEAAYKFTADSTSSYRVKITTTYNLFNAPKESSRIDIKYSDVFTATPNSATILLETFVGDVVYAGNEITIRATIMQPDGDAIPDGSVAFYYVEPNNNGEYSTNEANWKRILDSTTELNVADIQVIGGVAYAYITTSGLPAGSDGKMQTVAIVAKYKGDGTYKDTESSVTKTGADLEVTVYSSKVFAHDDVQNKVIGNPVTSTQGIIIFAPENVLVGDGSQTTLTLKPLYTLDGASDSTNTALADTIALYSTLSENLDYTVEWQVSKTKDASGAWTNWTYLGVSSSHNVTVAPTSNVAYRVKITTTDSKRTKNSNLVYYSNIIEVGNADVAISMLATPASSGATKNDDISFDVFVNSGTTIPSGDVQLVIKKSGSIVKTLNDTTTQGHVSFGGIRLPAGVYDVTATFTANGSFEQMSVTQEYIVRYTPEEITVGVDTDEYDGLIYNGFMQRPDQAVITFADGGHPAAIALAEETVVFAYEVSDGHGGWSPVGAPKDAGTYRVKAYLADSIYYIKTEMPGWHEFTIAKREVAISDILVQAKTYDGTKNVNVVDVQLGYVDGDAGVIPGDSVYAEITSGKAETEFAEALVENSVTFTATKLLGADASNYVFAESGEKFTADFTISRNRITVDSSGITGTALTGLKVYSAYGTTMSRGGSAGYTVTYYYHDGTGVRKTTTLTKAGMYTVVIQPVDTANYKGGETVIMNVSAGGAVAFANNDAAAPPVPGIITFAKVQQNYDNAGNEATATSSNGEAVTITYNTTVEVGRYLLTATASGCEPTYGVMNVYKVEANHIVPAVSDITYGDALVIDNEVAFLADTYFTYTGGEIIGVAYEKPTDAGNYVITAHVHATATTVAYIESSTFTINKKAITATVVDLKKDLYDTTPTLRYTASDLEAVDNDFSIFTVRPTFELLDKFDANANAMLNEAGTYTIKASGGELKNYTVTYVNGKLVVDSTISNVTMEIIGVPGGALYYSDTYKLSIYGTSAKLVTDAGMTPDNDSSVINYYVVDGNAFLSASTNAAISAAAQKIINGTTAPSAYVTVDADGRLFLGGIGTYTILATRGTGDEKIFTYMVITVNPKIIDVVMRFGTYEEDRPEYNGAVHAPNTNLYAVVGSHVAVDTLIFTTDPLAAVASDEYLVTVRSSNPNYTVKNPVAGIMIITPAKLTVAADDETVTYGDAPALTETLSVVYGTAPSPSAYTVTNMSMGSDVIAPTEVYGCYEAFTIAEVDGNHYGVYVSGKITVTPRDIDINAGVFSDVNAIYASYGRYLDEPNPVMGYEADSFVSGDSLADMILTSSLAGGTPVVPAGYFIFSQADDKSQPGTYNVVVSEAVDNVNSSAPNYNINRVSTEFVIYEDEAYYAKTAITGSTGTSLTVTTRDDFVQVYIYDSGTGDYVASGYYIRNHDVPDYSGALTPGEEFEDVGADIRLFRLVGSAMVPQSLTLGGDYYVKYSIDADNAAVTDTVANALVDVGDFDYEIYNANNVKVASGKFVSDGTGIYHATFATLPSGTYTVSYGNPTSDYVLTPAAGSFSVSGGGGGNDGGGDTTIPETKPPLTDLIRDDHFAYMVGDDDGNFRPNADITRAETAMVFYRLLVDKNLGNGVASFTDVDDKAWYATAVKVLASKGYLNGYEDGSFRPQQPITRAEFATLASRFDELANGKSIFSDVPSTHWAYSYIASAAAKGWINGYEDGTFRPSNNITRAEVATLANRVLGRVADRSYIAGHLKDIILFPDVDKTFWAYYNIIEATNGHEFTQAEGEDEVWDGLYSK